MPYRLIRALKPLLFKTLRRKPKYLLLLPLVLGLWYGYETLIARPAMSYMGLPQVESGIATQGWSHILRNQGYMVEYSEALANPLWVTYAVSGKQYKIGKRPRHFQADWRTFNRIAQSDYNGSGYDRGHMAPNYLIGTRYGITAQQQTFLMTNISPQKSNLNQKSWQRLEEVITSEFSQWHGDFWVVTGPIFAAEPPRLKNGKVAIPQAFYKIVIKPRSEERPAIALAFIFPQEAQANASLMTFVTTIDEVEKQTGIDFFAALDDTFEADLESSLTPEAWRLQEVANKPARY